ncbi:hypothetical protein B0T10DRAFT_493283 [Thelonectria olida]|uniref:Bacteriophage T5 Orf172 DNA-binding domain-containing protein n=1 Tax=Thelonectria olida TaxID=1576542 RepID=A0A9P8VXM7_9HYPO|nr:hypothetical protein B0T10DRAFT_493283 [Thelonectria olida]
MPDSVSPTTTPSKVSVPKGVTKRRKVSTGARNRSPARGSNSLSPVAQRQARRVSAGSAADPIAIDEDEDEPAPSNGEAERTAESDMQTPTKLPRAKSTSSDPSDGKTIRTPVPPLPRKSQSSPEVFRTPRSSKKSSPTRRKDGYEVESGIVDLIRRPWKQGAIKNADMGSNYIFSVLNKNTDDKLRKVGITKGPILTRQYQLQYTCRLELKQEPYPNQRLIRHYATAEKLIKAELQSVWHRYYCERCVQEHREFFMAPLELVVEVTQRWTAFCDKEPWDEWGTLRAFWGERLNGWEVYCDEKDDYKQRAKRWSKFVNPSWWDIARFNLVYLAKAIWPRRWEFVCAIQALFVMYVTFPNAWAIIIAWALQFALFLEAGLGNDLLIMKLSGGKTTSTKSSSSSNGSGSADQGGDGSNELEEKDSNDSIDNNLYENGAIPTDVIEKPDDDDGMDLD